MRLIVVLFLLLTPPVPLLAQRWVSGAELPLVQRAVATRSAQLTDTALASWRATARGLVRLEPVAEPGTVTSEVPAKADELVVAVHGRLPDRVKQVITDWRDTILLPTPFAPRYHRDHLGIVSTDFGNRIRLGDGDEVRDLIHPLSAEGLQHYEFALGDTLRITSGRDVILVVAVQVRPRDPTSPATVGTLFIDPDRHALVRFRFTFTPESYIDGSVRDITVTLESALLYGTHWLPSRQSILVRRNARAVRADWEIRDYVLGDRGADSLFRQGPDSFPAVGGLMWPRGSLSGETTVNTVLSQTPRSDEAVRSTAQEASEMLGRPIQRSRPIRLLGEGFLSVNRVQGYTLYPGLVIPVRRSLTLTVRAGYGFSDQRVFGLARLEGPVGRMAWRLEGERAMHDVGDVREYYGLLGFLYPLAAGRDPSDWTLISRGTLGLRIPLGQFQVTLDGGVERSESVVTRRPLRNDDRPNPALGAGTATVARLGVGRRWSNENEIDARVEIGRGDADWQRVAGRIKLHQPLGVGRAVLSLSGGVGSRGMPGYRHFVLGGSSSLPGVARRSLGGRTMALADLSYERRVSTSGFLGRVRPDRRPSGVYTVAPFVAAGMAGGDDPLLPWRGDEAVAMAVGLRVNFGPLPFSFGARVR